MCKCVADIVFGNLIIFKLLLCLLLVILDGGNAGTHLSTFNSGDISFTTPDKWRSE